MSTTEQAEHTHDVLLVVASIDPERTATLLLQILQLDPMRPMRIAVAAYGDEANSCAHVARAVSPPGSTEIYAYARPGLVRGGARWSAINFAIEAQAALEHGLPWVVVVLDDDVMVSVGWLQRLLGGLDPVKFALGDDDQPAEVSNAPQIGIVGPVTDQTTNPAQRVMLSQEEAALGVERYADARASHFLGVVSIADLVDGFCFAMTAAALRALAEGDEDGFVFDPALGAWAMHDVSLRLESAGLRVVVAEDVFVGRSRSVPCGHPKPGDVEERLTFYAKHRRSRGRVCAAIRVGFRGWSDLAMLTNTLKRTQDLVDCFVVLLRNNPLEMQADPEFRGAMRSMPEPTVAMLKACSDATPKKIAREFGHWITTQIAEANRPGIQVRAYCWDGEDDLAAQVSVMLKSARRMGASWVLSLDPDELVEDRIRTSHIERLLEHPNPMVRAWDASYLHHWDSGRLVRVDPPFGDGGSWRGGPHGIRLVRIDSSREVLAGKADRLPAFGRASARVAALRLRRYGTLRPADRERRMRVLTEDSLSVQAWSPKNGVGLHMLVYDGEQPEDVARWLDVVHGLVDHVVLVWTGEWAEGDKGWAGLMEPDLPGEVDWPETGPGRTLARVAAFHRAEWVHEPLDENIAQARNAGIQALDEHRGTEQPGLGWAWFMDPDEWMADEWVDPIALRRMAESDRWGWMMQIANYRNDGKPPTVSDSVRISRLDEGGVMRMDGRVHEGFHAALHQLNAAGIHPRWIYAPFVVQHRGMAFDAMRMTEKLDHYEHLLRLEIGDRPHSPGAWVSLGWHYLNDGHVELGMECLERARLCAGRSYLPFRELAFMHLREARRMMGECMARLEEGHQAFRACSEIQDFLVRYAPDHPKIRRADEREPMPLPDWEPPTVEGRSGYDDA